MRTEIKLSFILLLLFHFGRSQFRIDQSYIDSLNQRASDILFIYTDSSQRLAREALQLSQQSRDSLRIANAAHNLGLSYHVQGSFDQAIEHYQLAIRIRKGTPDESKIAGSLNNIASIHTSQGDYAGALSLYQESLNLKLKVGDQQGAANTLNNIGIIHFENGNYQQAIDYYQQALEIRQTLNLTAQIAASLGNLGLVYYEQKDFEKSLEYYQTGYDIMEDSKEICHKVYLSNGLGLAYFGLGNWTKSRHHSQQAYLDAKNCNDPTIMATSVNNLGEINIKLGNWTMAEHQLLEAYQIATNNNLNSELTDLCFSLYKFYRKTNDYQKALKYHEQFVNLRDSIESKEVTQKITALELTYDFEKEKDSLNFAQQKELLTYSEESKRQKVIRNYSLIVLGLTVLIIVILIRVFRIKQKSNQELSIKNELISRALREKEILFREIHHRVKNNLQIISSMLNIQRKTVTDSSTTDALKDAQNRVLAMSMVHNSLYDSNQIDQINAKDYLSGLIETLEEALCPPNLTVSIDIAPITLKTDDAINIGLLINEIFTNSVKHAFPEEKGQTQIQFLKEQNELVLSIKDDGKGMDSSRQNNSFGMNLIHSVVHSMNGSLTISDHNGTHFQISIPKHE